jgi:aminoglycoside/choline kinase family phosphotransferase
MDAQAEAWIRDHGEPTGPPELTHDRPWGSVWRVPTAGGPVWFKACAPVQAFEPRLTAALAGRHPTLLPDVLAHDDEHAWLLLGDLGAPIGIEDVTLDAYLELLPRYAELQLAEIAYAEEHLGHGVTDLRLEQLPDRYDRLVASELPLEVHEHEQLRAFAPHFRELCQELAAFGVPATIQHDDLHGNNLYAAATGTRILDWGDSSIAHPFFSFTQAYRHTPPEWHSAMRDAYLEPWGDHAACADLAIRLSWIAYVAGGSDVHDTRGFAVELREALAQI